MRRTQLDQIRQVSLARSDSLVFVYFKIFGICLFSIFLLNYIFRIICDNGDNMERIAKNVFLNEDTEQLVDCSKIPRVSLKPWTGKKTKVYVVFMCVILLFERLCG